MIFWSLKAALKRKINDMMRLLIMLTIFSIEGWQNDQHLDICFMKEKLSPWRQLQHNSSMEHISLFSNDETLCITISVCNKLCNILWYLIFRYLSPWRKTKDEEWYKYEWKLFHIKSFPLPWEKLSVKTKRHWYK